LLVGWFFGAIVIGTPINLEYVKERAPETLESQGYSIDAYLGYTYGKTLTPSRGGARVWYIVHMKNNPKVIYKAKLVRWGDEIHIYNLDPIQKIIIREINYDKD